MTIAQLFQTLIDATPPPADAAEPEDLRIAAAAILKAREPHIESLKQRIAAGESVSECSALLEVLNERDQRWEAALRRARHVLGQRLTARRRFRSQF